VSRGREVTVAVNHLFIFETFDMVNRAALCLCFSLDVFQTATSRGREVTVAVNHLFMFETFDMVVRVALYLCFFARYFPNGFSGKKQFIETFNLGDSVGVFSIFFEGEETVSRSRRSRA
jgi:hypothetical protein